MQIHTLSLLRLPAVLARRGVGRTLHWHDVKRGRFTPPVKIGRCTAWPSTEVDALLAAQVAGASPDELRALSAELVAKRASLKVSA
jgi:prophage regulatory protein